MGDATVLALLILFAEPPARAAAGADLPVEIHRLENGMQVILAPDPALSDVGVLVQLRAGSADDPDGLEGLAHLVEHLQFQGSRHVGPGEHARLIESAGGTHLQGETWPDRTLYTETVPLEALPRVLWLESDRLAFAGERLTEAMVAHERVIVGDEYETNVVGSEFSPLVQFTRNLVFPDWHPYHQPLWAGVAREAHLRDVRAFIRTWYSPRNASLILAGPFDPEATLNLVEKYFEDLNAADPPARPALPSWQVGGPAWHVLANVRHPQIVAAWPTPAFGTPEDRALDVVAAMLAGPTGMLSEALAAQGLSAMVSAREVSQAQSSFFFLDVQLADPEATGAARRIVARTLESLASGPDAGAVVRMRDRWTLSQLAGLQTSSGRAARLALMVDPDDPWSLRAYRSVDSKSIAEAVGRYLRPSSGAMVVALPAPGLPQDVSLLIGGQEPRAP